MFRATLLLLSNFNPRSLTGATTAAANCTVICAFQSTLPHGSDDKTVFDCDMPDISIHAPSRERPFFPCPAEGKIYEFQSTLPHGSDVCCYRRNQFIEVFQSTLPHGSDCIAMLQHRSRPTISIHAPSRERPQKFATLPTLSDISIHAPSRERQLLPFPLITI